MEWIIDAQGCDPAALRDLPRLQALLQQIVSDLGVNVVGQPQWHVFPGPGGITGMLLLSESHLTCHTYPEYAIATFNLYCCRQRPAWPWESRLKETLGAARVSVRSVPRATVPPVIAEAAVKVGSAHVSRRMIYPDGRATEWGKPDE